MIYILVVDLVSDDARDYAFDLYATVIASAKGNKRLKEGDCPIYLTEDDQIAMRRTSSGSLQRRYLQLVELQDGKKVQKVSLAFLCLAELLIFREAFSIFRYVTSLQPSHRSYSRAVRSRRPRQGYSSHRHPRTGIRIAVFGRVPVRFQGGCSRRPVSQRDSLRGCDFHAVPKIETSFGYLFLRQSSESVIVCITPSVNAMLRLLSFRI